MTTLLAELWLVKACNVLAISRWRSTQSCSVSTNPHVDGEGGDPALGDPPPTSSAIQVRSVIDRVAAGLSAFRGRAGAAIAPETARPRRPLDRVRRSSRWRPGGRGGSYPTRTRLTPWTAYAPGPPPTDLHVGPPGPWKNVVGLNTSYPLALLAGVVVASLVLSTSLIPRARHRRRQSCRAAGGGLPTTPWSPMPSSG